MLSPEQIDTFQTAVWQYYHHSARSLPWRDGPFDAYKILVSEVMLQQTQVSRVLPKYQSFLKRFPTIETLAEAPLGDVLREWSGLGYNRRAKYLHEAARSLASIETPWKLEDLVACKGVGKNTAAAVCVYAYNQQHVFIETNIRTVFIHHFFSDQVNVSDKEILEIVRQALPETQEEQPKTLAQPMPGTTGSPKREDSLWGGVRNPLGVSQYREWYWALMDYGSYLKITVGNASRQSKHHTIQSRFEGSTRQLRGQVLRLLSARAHTAKELTSKIADERLPTILEALVEENMIVFKDDLYKV